MRTEGPVKNAAGQLICPVCGGTGCPQLTESGRCLKEWGTEMTCTDGIIPCGSGFARCDVCHGKGCPDPRDEEIERLTKENGFLWRDLNQISSELGLPPNIGPAPGEIKRFHDSHMKLFEREKEIERLHNYVLALEQAINAFLHPQDEKKSESK